MGGDGEDMQGRKQRRENRNSCAFLTSVKMRNDGWWKNPYKAEFNVLIPYLIFPELLQSFKIYIHLLFLGLM